MKSNNIFKYIFIVFVIGLIIGTVFILYKQKKVSEEQEEETNSVQETSAKVLDNLTIGICAYDTMNPLLTNNKEVINLSKIIFEPLINLTPDYRTELCLAKSVTKKSDTNYEIKIDTNIKWQDGSNLIARDVEFTINKLKERNSVYSANVVQISNVDIPDAETINITLKEPVANFEYNLTFPIISSVYYANENFETTNKIPIGTGMYKIASIDENTILLTRNDKWRDIKEKTPKAKSITIKKYATMGEVYNSFKLGNVDIVNTSKENYTEYVGTMGYNKKEFKGRNYDFLSLNCEDIILKDKAVRQAINYGIDRNELVSSVLSNNYYVATSPLDYGSYLYSSEGELLFDQAKAKKVLEEGGWIYKNNKWQKSIDGYVRRLTLSLAVNKDNDVRKNVAQNIKKQLGEIGIVVNIYEIDDNKYQQYLNERNYQMILTGITNSMNPDLKYFYGDMNIANYNNQEVKNKIKSLDTYKDAQKQANDDAVYVGLYRSRNILLLNANIGGNFTPNNYNVYCNFYEWFKQE